FHREVGNGLALLLDPTHPPADGIAKLPRGAGLPVERVLRSLLEHERVSHEPLRALRHREIALGELAKERDLLHRADPDRALQPEMVDAAADVVVAVVELSEPLLHALLAGAARDFLEHPHHAEPHAGGERLVSLPFRIRLRLAVPVEDLV